MKYFTLIMVCSLIAMLTWSCSDSTSTDLQDARFSPRPYAKAKRVPVQADSMNGLAQQITGFGGLFLNNSGQLSIYLTQPDKQKATAQKVLSNSQLITTSSSLSAGSVEKMKVLKGQYTFTELSAWKTKIFRNILSMDDVYSSGIDHSENKVSVGVKDKSTKHKVIEKLADLHILKDAVLIYQMSKPEFMIGHE